VYDSLGYHLIDSNDVDYGEISDITYSGTSFITVPVLVPASGSFAIVKYYQSLITSPPTKSISSKRYGELMRTGEISFSIANAKEVTYTSSTCVALSTSSVEATSPYTIVSTGNIGKKCLLKYTSNILTRTIIDVDVATHTVYFDKAFDSFCWLDNMLSCHK